MKLRPSVLAAVVAAATGAVAWRALHSAPATPALSIDAPAVAPGAARRAPPSARAARIVVYVAGDVRRRGLYELPASSRAADALRAAGGALPDADLVAINLAQPLNDGDEVAVSAIGADGSSAAGTAKRGSPHRGHHKKKRHRKHARPASDAPEASLGPSSVVEVNSADESELETLPGIGPSLAERIVAFRERTGPFGSPDDLLDVAGMTPSKLDAIAPYLSVAQH